MKIINSVFLAPCCPSQWVLRLSVPLTASLLFQAIVVTASDVVIDLNGFTIRQSQGNLGNDSGRATIGLRFVSFVFVSLWVVCL